MIQKSFFFLLLTLSLGLNSALPNNKIQSFSLEYVYDETDTLSIDEVVNEKFTLIPSQNSLNNHYDTVWYKVTIPSSPNKHSQLYLHNKLAYLSDHIDIYELTGKTIVKNSIDLLGNNVANKMTGSTVIYPFSRYPDKTKTIFIKNKALIHQIIDIDIYDKKKSAQALINKNYFSNFIISCLFALALYNAMMFFYNKRKEFLIYAVYLMNAAIGLSYLYGTVFHNFNIYGGKVYWLNITAILVPLFLALFVQFVFETHKTSRKVHWVFNSVIVLATIYVAIATFISVPLAIDLLGILYIASFSAICFFVIHFFKKKHILIRVFSIAYFVYVFGMSITFCTLMGDMPYNAFTFYASGVSILIEAVLFSYLLNFRMILLEKEVINQAAIQEKLKHLASVDHLTNILNRRAFMEQAEAAISLAKRHNEPLSVIMIDLDLFKKVNDVYGHHTGDAVLSIFAKTVSSIIRNEDIFGRIGGEEFSVIFPKVTKDKALLVSEKIRKAVANKEIQSERYKFQQTISIGLSILTENDEHHIDIQKRADKALYEAKENGRNQVVFK